jgi:hypothetical protein
MHQILDRDELPDHPPWPRAEELGIISAPRHPCQFIAIGHRKSSEFRRKTVFDDAKTA